MSSQAFPSGLTILIIEDNLTDAKLIEREVHKILTSPQIFHVSTFPELRRFLPRQIPDIVLSDYRLDEGFSGLDALLLVNQMYSFVPFIFITGTLDDEELAAQTILSGASGFILKKNISQLHKKLLPYIASFVHKKGQRTQQQEQIDSMMQMIEQISLESQQYKADMENVRKFLQDLP